MIGLIASPAASMSSFSWSSRSFALPDDPGTSEATSEPASLNDVPTNAPACVWEKATQPRARADQTSSDIRPDYHGQDRRASVLVRCVRARDCPGESARNPPAKRTSDRAL